MKMAANWTPFFIEQAPGITQQTDTGVEKPFNSTKPIKLISCQGFLHSDPPSPATVPGWVGKPLINNELRLLGTAIAYP